MSSRAIHRFGVGVLFTLAACGAPPPKSQFPTADAALDRMHAGYACSNGVRGSAKLDQFSPRARIKGDVDLFAMLPDRVRFDAEKFGVNVFTLTADGKDFKLYDGTEKAFYFGPAKTCNLARLTQVPVPGHALVSILRGEAPVLVHDASQAKIAWDDGGFYRITIESKHSAVETIELEIPDEDLEKPYAEQRVRVTRVLVTQREIDLYEVELDDHTPMKTAPPREDPDGIDEPILPSGPPCAAELPRQIRMRVPNTRDDLTLKYQEAEWNPPLLPETFTQPIPGGVSERFVDCE